MKLKIKIAAITVARALLLLVFSVLFTAFFALYIVLMVAEWYIAFYSGYVADTRALLVKFDEQLNGKK